MYNDMLTVLKCLAPNAQLTGNYDDFENQFAQNAVTDKAAITKCVTDSQKLTSYNYDLFQSFTNDINSCVTNYAS
jgi:hypothetical protein